MKEKDTKEKKEKKARDAAMPPGMPGDAWMPDGQSLAGEVS